MTRVSPETCNKQLRSASSDSLLPPWTTSYCSQSLSLSSSPFLCSLLCRPPSLALQSSFLLSYRVEPHRASSLEAQTLSASFQAIWSVSLSLSLSRPPPASISPTALGLLAFNQPPSSSPAGSNNKMSQHPFRCSQVG